MGQKRKKYKNKRGTTESKFLLKKNLQGRIFQIYELQHLGMFDFDSRRLNG
jgi:hypothetical protein